MKRPVRTSLARVIAAAIFPFAFMQCSAGSYAPGPIDRADLPLRITKVRGHVHLVEDVNYWRTNSVVYTDPRGIVFINATWTPATARRLIFEASLVNEADFLAVVVTSFGLHHTGGVSEFQAKGIKVYTHETTRRLMVRRWGSMQSEMKNSFGSWRLSSAVRPDGLFRERLSIHGGDVIIFHPGPAHTPDNLVVYFRREKILYGGSLLADPAMFMTDANPAAYGRALAGLDRFDYDQVISGHGRPLREPSLVERLKIRYANFGRLSNL